MLFFKLLFFATTFYFVVAVAEVDQIESPLIVADPEKCRNGKKILEETQPDMEALANKFITLVTPDNLDSSIKKDMQVMLVNEMTSAVNTMILYTCSGQWDPQTLPSKDDVVITYRTGASGMPDAFLHKIE